LHVFAEKLEQCPGNNQFVGGHLTSIDLVVHGLDKSGEGLALVATPQFGVEISLLVFLEAGLEF